MGKTFQAMRIIFLSALILLLIISPASSIQTFKQNEPVKLCHPVRQGGNLPASATCNLTVSFSNGTRLIDFAGMDDLGDNFCYNLTSSDTSRKGIYNYEATCTDGINNATLDSEFLINLGGVEPSSERTDTISRTIYIFFGLAVLFFLSLFWIKKTPMKISLFLIMLLFILMVINVSYISIQDEVVNESIENFFSFFLTASFYINYGIFALIIIVWLVTFFVTIFERKQNRRNKIYG